MAFLIDTPDLLSRAHYGERLVCVPSVMRIPSDVAPEEGERLGRYFERLVLHGITSLAPVRHARGLQIVHEGRTLGELDMVFQLPGEEVTHHWELSIKYYLKLGEQFVGLMRRDRLDLKLHKLFSQQLRLSEHPATRASLNRLGYPSRIQSQAWVKGMLFYPWGETPSFPVDVSPDHARGSWSVGFPAPYRLHTTLWVQLSRLTWLTPFCGPRPVGALSGVEAAQVSEGQTGLMWARIEQDGELFVERERLCVVAPEWVTR
jgi:hypothetical protein